MSARLGWSLRWRLSVLWFLEWGITGAVMTYIPIYWESINLAPHQRAQLAAVAAVGLWVAPFVVGQIADRWMAVEKLLAVSHFLGGIALYAMASGMERFGKTGTNFQSLIWLVAIFAVAYFPTVPLVSVLCFRHLQDPDHQFGKVRVWGTVGWMCAGLTLSFWLANAQVFEWLSRRYAGSALIGTMRSFIQGLGDAQPSDCFRISALLSFALSSFCIFLPHTPPANMPRDRIAAVAVLGMFKDRTFALFLAISFLLALLVVPMYSLAVPLLLQSQGIAPDWVPTVMLVGQISEFPALLLLSFCLRHLGLKTTFALGIAAWTLRYAFFTAGAPWSLVLTGLGLHGVCHVFLIIVAQLYIDAQSRKDARATAQNLLSFITLGIGMPLGMLISGNLQELFADNSRWVFVVPALASMSLLAAFWKWIHFPAARPAA